MHIAAEDILARDDHRRSAMERLALGAALSNTLQELAQRTLDPLREIAGASTALLYQYDGDGRMVPVAGDTWIPEVYWPYWADDPAQRATKKLQAKPRLALADRLAGPELKRSAVYADFYRPQQIEHLCCVFLTRFAHGSPGMTNILLARDSRAEPYSDNTLETLQVALLLLSAAVERVQTFPQTAGGERALRQWIADQSCVLAKTSGRVEWVSPAAAKVLGSAAFARLPDSLTSLVDSLVHSHASAPLVPPAAHWRLADGRLLRAQLSLIALADDEPRVLVQLKPEDPSLLEQGQARYRLTRSEAQVLECLAAGRSNQQIAEALYVSEATVRSHLKNAYKKMAVRTRTEAVLAWLALGNAAP